MTSPSAQPEDVAELAGHLPIVGVVGATATGKSDLGLSLAERLDGEIVNADSMQFYRGMDIGTAKLPVADRRGISHHQIDVLDVTEEASVARYQVAAREDIAAIRGRGRLPILVGGSGLYVRAALDRLHIPPTDPEVRGALETEAEVVGAAAMYERLREQDPDAARHIQRNNVRRVIRALEVISLTGRPFSATMPTREFVSPAVLLGLRVDKEILAERIQRRVDRMWTDGLRGEAEGLLGRGLRDGVTASRAIGYSQAIAVIDGVMTEAEARDDTAMATRRYARRQEAWFRPESRVTWLDASAAADAAELVAPALEVIRRATP